MIKCYAKNWPIRFPGLVNSPAIKAYVLREMIRCFDLDRLNAFQLTIERNSPLTSIGTQLASLSAATVRKGIASVWYAGESNGIIREYFSVVASAVMGTGLST